MCNLVHVPVLLSEREQLMNTVILTQDLGAINSNDYWGYALQPFVHQEDEEDEDAKVRVVNLIACRGEDSQSNVIITHFYGGYSNPSSPLESPLNEEACAALESLLNAIDNGDKVWDVSDYNSNL